MLFVILAAGSAQAAVFPVGQPEYQYFYDLNLRTETLNPDKSDYQIGPFPATRFNRQLGPFESWRNPPQDQLQWFLQVILLLVEILQHPEQPERLGDQQ